MCFFINILKIAISTERFVIIHQTSAFIMLLAETSLYYLAIFVVEMQGLVLSPGAGYPRYATDTHILIFGA